MTVNFDLTALGAWELTYFQKLVGEKPSNSIRGIPWIEPLELPYLTDKHVFLVGASWINAKPTWIRAGYFYQQISDIRVDGTVIFEGIGSNPTTEVDGAHHLIKLNTVQLVIFPKLLGSYRLRFEALPWIQQITLAVWEYVGVETNSTEDLIQSVRAKLETIEYKINNL